MSTHRRKKRRKPREPRHDAIRKMRMNMSIRLSSMHTSWESHDELQAILNLPSFSPLSNVPEGYTNRATLIQAMAIGSVIQSSPEPLEAKAPSLVMAVLPNADFHIQFRAEFPKNLHGFWLVATEEEVPMVMDYWFASLMHSEDLKKASPETQELFFGWDETSLAKLHVLPTIHAIAFIKMFMSKIYPLQRQGAGADGDLSLIGDPTWVDVFEFIDKHAAEFLTDWGIPR